MAVLSTLLGIEANILINGQPVHEYPDDDDIEVEHEDELVIKHQAARTVSRYIESEDDSNFAISLSVGPPIGFKQQGKKKMQYVKIGFHITVDGMPAANAWCARPWFNKNPDKETWKETIKGVVEGKGRACTLKRFRFANIETRMSPHSFPRIFALCRANSRAADSVPGQPSKVDRIMQHMQKVGTIEIRVFSENYGKRGGDMDTASEGFLESNDETIPEKALKGQAKSHSTALDEAQKAKRGNVYRTEKVDGEDYPLVIFRFMYRSQESLKQLQIIPRTPSPSPPPTPLPPRSPSPDLIDGMTAAQHKEIADKKKFFAEQNQEKKRNDKARQNAAKIKKERVTEIKRERNAESKVQGRAAKRAKKGGPIETIVLSSDSEREE